MRLTPFARRSTALVAATALISSGGALTGLLAGNAFAAPGDQAVVATVSPQAWDNRSSVTVTLTGSGFMNTDKTGKLNDRVVFKPLLPDLAHEVGDFEVAANFSASSTVLSAKVNLATAPTGTYSVVVRHSSAFGGAESSPTSVATLTVYGYGSANANSVASGPDASGLDTFGLGLDCDNLHLTVGTGCNRGAGALDITGSNIAIGADVRFLRPDGTPDPGLSFAAGDPVNFSNTISTEDAKGNPILGTGYPNSTLLQGNYKAAGDTNATTPGFTPGWHKLQIVNNDGKTAGTTVDFAQPWFAAEGGITPTTIGLGAQNVVLTVHGAGIRAGSRLGVDSGATQSTLTTPGCDGVTVGASSLSDRAPDGTYNTISVPVSVASCTSTDGRAVTIAGPDGGYYRRTGILALGGFPNVTQINNQDAIALGQGAHVGFVPGSEVTISGTSFVGMNQTDPAKMTKFSFGDKVTATTVSVLSPGTALVTLDVLPDARTGDHNAVATNPDGGSSVTGHPTVAGGQGPDPTKTAPLFVNPGPKATSVDPSSLQPAQSGTTITVKGTFNTKDTYTVNLSPGTGISTGSVATPDASTLTFAISTNGATSGAHDLTITDTVDSGRAVCTACMGVDSLAVVAVNGTVLPDGATASASNSGTDPVTLTVKGTGVPANSKVTLTRQGEFTGQGPIEGTSVTQPATDELSAAFSLTSAEPGKYNLTVAPATAGASTKTWSCTGCVNVTGGPMTTTGITPANGGQGATNRLITISGKNFSHGMTVSIPDKVAVTDVTFVNPTTLTARVAVPADATPGVQTVTVAAGDGSADTTQRFTVDAAPSLASISPAAYGQGAGTAPGSAQKVTVNGAGIDAGATISLGDPEIAFTSPAVTTDPNNSQTCSSSVPSSSPVPTVACSENLKATIVISSKAATVKHDLTLVNGDGGTATLAGAFTVNPGPRVLSVTDESAAPALRPDGKPHTITIVGSAFSTDGKNPPVVSFLPADLKITLGAVTVVSGAQLTVPVTVAADEALRGPVSVAVTNPADQGYGTCDAATKPCAYVGAEPGSPAPLTLTPGGQSLVATWAAAAPNGPPVDSYRITYTRSGTTLTPTTLDVPGTKLAATLPDLVNGASYDVTVQAVNAVGGGPVAKATGLAGLPSAPSLGVSAAQVVIGQQVGLSGRLVGSGGAALAGKTLVLAFYPWIGRPYTRTVTTSSTGLWKLVVVSPYNVKVRVLWAGDSLYRPTSSVFRVVGVATKVVKASPATGSRSSAGSVLRISGSVGPNKAGKVVYLYRYVGRTHSLVARAGVTRASTYTFALTPGRGTYTFRVFIPSTPGNLAGSSIPFTLYRV